MTRKVSLDWFCEVSAEVNGCDVDFLTVEVIIHKTRVDVTRAIPASVRAKLIEECLETADCLEADADQAARDFALDQKLDERKGS